MKKRYILFCCIALLTGCSREASTQQPETKKAQPAVSTKEPLQIKKWILRSPSQGDGNEQGFYRIKSTDNGKGDIYSNLLYTDYQSRKEIYLCDKPECRHNNASCTSYYPGLDAVTQLIVHKKHIYLIANEDFRRNEQQEYVSVPPRIIQMDLDGKHQRELMKLPAGFSFSYEDMAVADDMLYIPVEKTENVSTDSDSINTAAVQVIREKQLYAIRLDSGKYKAVVNLKNKQIIGSMGGRELVVNAYHYKTDPKKLLDQGDFAGYEAVTQQADITYERISVDTGRVIKSHEADAELLGIFAYDSVYYTDDTGCLKQLDMKTGRVKKLKQLDASSVNLMYADEQQLFLYINEKEYIYSLKEKTLLPHTLKLPDTQEPIRLLGETSTMYYVIYAQTGKVKRTWAGTDQYEAASYSYGFIKKEDYWKNKASFLPVETLKGVL